jgi:hypothetical protein
VFRFDREAKRTPEQIPTIEYVNAACWILERAGSLVPDDLHRELLSGFGWEKLTEPRREVLESAMSYAVGAERIAELDDGRLSLRK